MESSDALVFEGDPRGGWKNWNPENTIFVHPCATIQDARAFLEKARIKIPEDHVHMAIVRKETAVNGHRIKMYVACLWDTGSDHDPEERKSIPEARGLRDNPGRKHGANKFRPAIETLARGQ
jgi:hypothetical protein